jgi:hypothetical protein
MLVVIWLDFLPDLEIVTPGTFFFIFKQSLFGIRIRSPNIVVT